MNPLGKTAISSSPNREKGTDGDWDLSKEPSTGCTGFPEGVIPGGVSYERAKVRERGPSERLHLGAK